MFTMQITVFEASGQREAQAGDLSGLLARQAVLWADMTGPTDEDIRAMREVFEFHPLTIEQTHDEKQRPKIEEYSDYLFLILNPVTPGEDRLAFRELDVFVGANYMVTVHSGPEPTIVGVRRRLANTPNGQVTIAHLLYSVLDETVDEYFPVLDAAGASIEAIEQLIVTAPREEVMNQIIALKRVLNNLWRVLWPQRDVVHSLLNHDYTFLDKKEVKHHLRDVSEHMLWLSDMIDNFRDMLTGLSDLYMSAVSLRLGRSVNRLTIWAVIIGMLTVVSAFYGMNFLKTWPPYTEPWGIMGVVAIMALLVGALVWVFRREG
jgi:magnesium transporter